MKIGSRILGVSPRIRLQLSDRAKPKTYDLRPVCKVLLFQNPAMMQLMPRDDVSQPPHADFVLICDAASRPRRLIEIAQQRKRGSAHRDKVFDQIGQRTLRERTIPHIVILLVTFNWRSVGA